MPKTEAIYFCVVSCMNLADQSVEYHYSFLEFRDGSFVIPPFGDSNIDIKVEGWTELQDPAPYFKEKAKIISL